MTNTSDKPWKGEFPVDRAEDMDEAAVRILTATIRAGRTPSFGVWINQAQTWAFEPFTFKRRRFDTMAQAQTWLVESGFVDTTDATVHMSAYVTHLPAR